MNFKLEVIGFTIEACRAAQSAGAHRIELCDNPGEGGTTPSYGFIKAARKYLSIELSPIIRPRGGDFLYSDEEFEIMKTDIQLCKEVGCDGVVMGILNSDGTVDKKRSSQLVQLAHPMGVTFHRAFDRVENAEKALEDIIEIGCKRILTSGLVANALDGATTIAMLVKQANDRIILMPGSGVRSNNIGEIANKTGAAEFHTSARILTKTKMQFINSSMNENLQSVTADEEEIRKMAEILRLL
jgi:copper homeostasis protein